MATFKFGRTINIHWNGYDIKGPANTIFSIPDQLYEEFNADIAPVEPTLTWIDTNEFGTLSLLNNKVYYQTSQPTATTLTVGDLWIDSDDVINGAIGVITATAPISATTNTSTATTSLTISNATTTNTGVVQLSDSVSTTSSVLAATPTAVKSAYDLAAGKVASVSGSGAISSSGGTAPTISIAAAGTATVGAVQLTDSTSSTSTTTAATPNSVKTAYDLANAAVPGNGWEIYSFGNSGVIGTHPRYTLTTSNANTSGVIVHTRLIPHKNFTVSNLSFTSAATASSGLTLCRFGIYTRSGTTFTLVARTASDTTLFNAQNTKYTRALDTTGGYPATYAMTAGSEYWISFIQVGTTMATTLSATSRTATAANAATGGQTYTQSGQTDLPSSSTGTLNTSRAEYAEVS